MELVLAMTCANAMTAISVSTCDNVLTISTNSTVWSRKKVYGVWVPDDICCCLMFFFASCGTGRSRLIGSVGKNLPHATSFYLFCKKVLTFVRSQVFQKTVL